MSNRAQELARGAFQALGCLDCARVDMRLDDDGNFYILEINSLPSLGEHGSYVQAAEAAGMDFPALINRLVDVASARYFGTPSPPEITEATETPAHKVFSFITSRRDRLETRVQELTQLSSRSLDPLGIRAATAEIDQSMLRLGLKPVASLTDAPEVATWETERGLEDGTLLIGTLDVPLPLRSPFPRRHFAIFA